MYASVGGDPMGRAMQTFIKNTCDHQTPKHEPEQLDLFAGYPSHEPLSATRHTISSVVCHQIASAACFYHALSAQHVTHIRNLITHQCSGDSGQSVWHDYVMGLASTMSFIPTPMQQTFHQSDRAALASDWANVQSDLNQVWQAITTAERN